MQPPVILIRGGASAGKTTISQKVASKLKKSVVISQDDIRHMVVGGLVATESVTQPPDDPEEYFRQSQLADQNVALLAKNFIKHGYVVVIDGFNAGESGNIFQIRNGSMMSEWYPSIELEKELFGNLNLQTIVLTVSDQILTKRLKRRGWSGDVLDFVTELHHTFRQMIPTDRIELVVDTSEMGIEETIELIIDKLGLNLYSVD